MGLTRITEFRKIAQEKVNVAVDSIQKYDSECSRFEAAGYLQLLMASMRLHYKEEYYKEDSSYQTVDFTTSVRIYGVKMAQNLLRDAFLVLFKICKYDEDAAWTILQIRMFEINRSFYYPSKDGKWIRRPN